MKRDCGLDVVKLWVPVAAWCGVIFALSSVTDLSSGLAYDYPLRKCAHVLEYAVLWFLCRRASAGSGLSRPGLSAFAFSVLYAATDEYHQTFVPGRNGCLSDVLIDCVGTALAALAGRPGVLALSEDRLPQDLQPRGRLPPADE